MLDLLFWIAIFVVSLAVLVKAASYFTKYSEKLGSALGIPQFIIGVTIISIGTSLPELATSLIAVFKGSTEIVAGNAVGSNIANILLVVGLTAVLTRKMVVKRSLINLDAPLLLAVTFLAGFVLWDKQVTFVESLFLIASYLVYILYSVYSRSKGEESSSKKGKVSFKMVAMIALGGLGVYLGAKYSIDSVLNISEILKINSSVIALSAIALGTSLPEVLVSISAARKGNYEMALGNVFGSNIFNIAMVIGIPGLISTLDVSGETFLIAIPFMVAATILYVVSGISQKIYGWEGALYLVIYFLFIGKLFGLV
ncbi:MAG: calcium/sodium antiporter [Parcubacteria group bacterium]|nr:calcium/sodium antiporter [Parcubacteria group bacterium]